MKLQQFDTHSQKWIDVPRIEFQQPHLRGSIHIFDNRIHAYSESPLGEGRAYYQTLAEFLEDTCREGDGIDRSGVRVVR